MAERYCCTTASPSPLAIWGLPPESSLTGRFLREILSLDGGLVARDDNFRFGLFKLVVHSANYLIDCAHKFSFLVARDFLREHFIGMARGRS